MREVERAVNKGIAIIPFRIENVIPSKAMEYFLSIPHWLDALTPPLEKHLQKLADTIQALLAEIGKPAITDKEYVVAEKRPVETTKKGGWHKKWAIISLIAFIVIAGSVTGIVLLNQLRPTPTPTQTPIIGITPATVAPISFPDANLYTAIREAINKTTGPIYTSDLESITILSAKGRNISNLTGIEYCVNLKFLDLLDNDVTGISPLAGCTNLEILYLWGNDISDISPLAGLIKLKELRLRDNKISDISPLADLANLEELYLVGNNISVLPPRLNFTKLRVLYLWGNDINDISSLASLTNIQELHLADNNISDLSPLMENRGLSAGDIVYVMNNPLSTESMDVYIPQLQNRGVTVLFQ